MGYRLSPGKPVADEVLRVVREQIERALAETRSNSLARDEVIHQVRKRCKKLRAVLRLARPALGSAYRLENAFFRDAAHALSAARDADVAPEAYDKLVQRFRDEVPRRSFAPVRAALTRRRARASPSQADIDARIGRFQEEMMAAQRRLADWYLPADGFGLLEDGLSDVYRRARKRMTDAYANPSAENFHEWRKAVKYHWYHARLLCASWPLEMQSRCQALKGLSELLGDEHDLIVLRGALLDGVPRGGTNGQRAELLALLERRRVELQAAARPLGERLFAEKPKQHARRLRAYWSAAPLPAVPHSPAEADGAASSRTSEG